MSIGNPVAADVPGIFDVVINGHGYIFDRAQDPRAIYTYSPTFVERSNVQGDYGDNQQDFWLTFSQKDFSLGADQAYFRSTDPESQRRFSDGSNLDVTTTPGQAGVPFKPKQMAANPFGSGVLALASCPSPGAFYVACDNKHVFTVSTSGAASDLGAYPSSTASSMAVCTDSTGIGAANLFLSTGAKVDRYDGTWHTFASTGAADICFLNNTLYGFGTTAGAQTDLCRWDTSGSKTTLFVWKGGAGTTYGAPLAQYVGRSLVAFGGKLLILVRDAGEGHSLWLYDGIAPSIIANFPTDFYADDICVKDGTVFISGHSASTVFDPYARVYYYASGTLNILWNRAGGGSGSPVKICPYRAGLLIWGYGVRDEALNSTLVYYDTRYGGITPVLTATPTDSINFGLAMNPSGYVFLRFGGTATISHAVWPDGTGTFGYVPTATLVTSKYDGDSSLAKYFKAVKLDFGSTGAGASIDVAYAIDGSTSFTTAQASAVSGTEYTIGASGHTIQLKITIHSTTTETISLRRTYVRAAPVKQSFPQRDYILDLTGKDGNAQVALNNGQTHPLDGYAQALLLQAAITSATPVSVTDRFGTYTAILEPDGCSFREERPEEFIGTIRVRGT